MQRGSEICQNKNERASAKSLPILYEEKYLKLLVNTTRAGSSRRYALSKALMWTGSSSCKLVKYGRQEQRDMVASELKGQYKALAQNKYSKVGYPFEFGIG